MKLKLSLVTLAALCATLRAYSVFHLQQDVSHQGERIALSSISKSGFNIQSFITEGSLKLRAEDLFKIAQSSAEEHGHPTRVVGSQGHKDTIKYIMDEIKSFGDDFYNVATQNFTVNSGIVNKHSFIVEGVKLDDVQAFDMTPATPESRALTAKLSIAKNNGCDASDFEFESTQDTIVLIQRGVCPFGDKSSNAGKAGARAAIIYDSEFSNNTLRGTLGQPDQYHVPTLAIKKQVGEDLIRRNFESSDALSAEVLVDSKISIIETCNVIAETKGGDKNNVVMLGGHSDSVAAGPGINDDGSGSMSLLEVAKALAQYSGSLKNAVRFAWWAGEEEGLLGSDHYANALSIEENLRIRMFGDYDMMSSPNGAYQVYDANNKDNPVGSEELKNFYIDFYKAAGVNHTLIPFDGRSDYDGFIRNGIPGGGVATGAEVLKTEDEAAQFGGKAGEAFDPCYHQLCDNLDNLDYKEWVLNTQLIAQSVATFSASLDGFPKRDVKSISTKYFNPQFKYHGSKLIM